MILGSGWRRDLFDKEWLQVTGKWPIPLTFYFCIFVVRPVEGGCAKEDLEFCMEGGIKPSSVLSRLVQHRVEVQNCCPVSAECDETINHSLYNCSFAKALWLRSGLGRWSDAHSISTWIGLLFQRLNADQRAMMIEHILVHFKATRWEFIRPYFEY